MVVMMTYYERIQKSIDYIEDNLENEIDLNVEKARASKGRLLCGI